jgi:hypothetical protein
MLNTNTKTYTSYKPQFTNLNAPAPAHNQLYADYRCIDPVATNTGSPWFPIDNTCPCDPKLSNPTGRGFTACSFGIQTQDSMANSVSNLYNPNNQLSETKLPGAFFPDISSFPIMSVPQFQPRPLAQIGYTWRSAN